MTVKLGVPSKGRLMEKTFQWFGERGVTLSRSGSEREYSGAVEGVEGVDLVLLSAGMVVGATVRRRKALALRTETIEQLPDLESSRSA